MGNFAYFAQANCAEEIHGWMSRSFLQLNTNQTEFIVFDPNQTFDIFESMLSPSYSNWHLTQSL